MENGKLEKKKCSFWLTKNKNNNMKINKNHSKLLSISNAVLRNMFLNKFPNRIKFLINRRILRHKNFIGIFCSFPPSQFSGYTLCIRMEFMALPFNGWLFLRVNEQWEKPRAEYKNQWLENYGRLEGKTQQQQKNVKENKRKTDINYL